MLIGAAVGVLAAAFAVAQLRHGVLPTWDSASYWNGGDAIRRGDLFGSHLQPSFSNFTVIDFLERDGRLPFVDFPLGYPVLIAVLGVVIGTKTAMAVWTVLAVAAVVVLITIGSRPRRSPPPALAVRGVLALGLVATSPFRIVTRGGMTEPLFCVAVLGLVLALVTYRRDGRGWPAVVGLGIAAGLLRFMGASLALLVFAERQRRTRRPLESLAWAAAVAGPAAINALWASRAGGGHSARFHAITGHDVERLARSVGGWVDARHANVALTYFSGEGAAWWAWILTVVWLGAMVVAALSLCGVRGVRLPVELELTLAAAGILTAALAIGMAGFDDLVTPDNRILLPMGLLTLAGLAWSMDGIRGRQASRIAAAAVAIWALVAVLPRGPGDPYFPVAREPVTVAAARASGADVIVSTDADLMNWYTGLPAAYPPKARFDLTDEDAGEAGQWAALPCALADANGVLVVPEGGGLFGLDGERLAALVDDGLLLPAVDGAVVLYWPNPDLCAPAD